MDGQIFDESFEAAWKDFDRAFRARLLKRIQELGSLYRLAIDRDEAGRLIGERFYEALESTLAEGKYLDAFRRAVVGSPPATFSELVGVFKRCDAYPLHAFVLLGVFLHDHPFRAFFSSRDETLPFNTLTLRFTQDPGDRLPSDVRYELERLDARTCPAMFGRRSDTSGGAASPVALQAHPKNHIWDLIYIWHFDEVLD